MSGVSSATNTLNSLTPCSAATCCGQIAALEARVAALEGKDTIDQSALDALKSFLLGLINNKAEASTLASEVGRLDGAIAQLLAEIGIVTAAIAALGAKLGLLNGTIALISARLAALVAAVAPLLAAAPTLLAIAAIGVAGILTALAAAGAIEAVRSLAESAFAAAGAAQGKAGQAIGTANTANGKADQAIGTANSASGKADQAIGISNTASGKADQAIGTANTASGKADQAIGAANTAHGKAEQAIGTANTAHGKADQAIGTANTASGKAEQAIGTANTAIAIAQASAKTPGLPGPRGLPGVAGPRGLQGVRGVAGVAGVAGVPGAVGPRGVQGVAGAPGIAGVPGATGARGAQGVPGVPGAVGARGAQGVPGKNGVVPTTIGDKIKDLEDKQKNYPDIKFPSGGGIDVYKPGTGEIVHVPSEEVIDGEFVEVDNKLKKMETDIKKNKNDNNQNKNDNNKNKALILDIQNNCCGNAKKQPEPKVELSPVVLQKFLRCHPQTKEPEYTTYVGTVVKGTEVVVQTQALQLAQIEGQQCKECDALLAVPEYWSMKVENFRPQLIVVYRVFENNKWQPTQYAITIPYPKANYQTRPTIKPNFPAYIKGNYQGILTLKDNSKLIANCKDEGELTTLMAILKATIDPSKLTDKPYKTVRHAPGTYHEKTVRPYKVMYYPNGRGNTNLGTIKPAWIWRLA